MLTLLTTNNELHGHALAQVSTDLLYFLSFVDCLTLFPPHYLRYRRSDCALGYITATHRPFITQHQRHYDKVFINSFTSSETQQLNTHVS